ncbi:MAG: flavodoxin family protein [Erysipelotrichaceae bacterium]
MKYGIIYTSKTGNTKKIAEAMKDALAQEECIVFDDHLNPLLSKVDLIFLGSWTDKGTCSEEMKQFYAQLSNQKIALFGTAGFGGSQDYFDQLTKRSMNLLPKDCRVIGSFYCQGKMKDGVRNRYVSMLREHPDDKQLKVSIANFEEAKKHPDEKDLMEAKAFALKMMNSIR